MQLHAEVIVVNDKKLDQHDFFCCTDGVENSVESSGAIDQQSYGVVCQARHAP